MSSGIEFTGERMVPEKADANTFWEHIYRYRFATTFVNGKKVLDIACGEGYGAAALMQSGATSVIGVDVSPEACEHATHRYGIKTRLGDAQNIPLENASVDTIVSFETIEHVSRPEIFLDECVRVLAPGGQIIISTPNHDAARFYHPDNPFHCSELTIAEFKTLIEERFVVQDYYSQRPFKVVWWSLRGLSAISWPVRKIRGVERLLALLRDLLCPHLKKTGTDFFRQDPLAAIQKNPMPFTSLIDPYAIRTLASSRAETPLFMIAIANRR